MKIYKIYIYIINNNNILELFQEYFECVPSTEKFPTQTKQPLSRDQIYLQPVQQIWIDRSQERRGWCFPSGKTAYSVKDLQIPVWQSHHITCFSTEPPLSPGDVPGMTQSRRSAGMCVFVKVLTIFTLASGFFRAEARDLRGGLLLTFFTSDSDSDFK